MQPKTVATYPITEIRTAGPYKIIGGWLGKACTARLNNGKMFGRVSVDQ